MKALKTINDYLTIAQQMQMAYNGLSYYIDGNNKFVICEPTKFNPDWFPDRESTTRPAKGHSVNYFGRYGFILFVADGEAFVKFPDTDDTETFDLDMFMSHTSRGARTIWEL